MIRSFPNGEETTVIYANDVNVGMGPTDIHIALLVYGSVMYELALPYITARELHRTLGKALESVDAEVKMPTGDEMRDAFYRMAEKEVVNAKDSSPE